MRFWGGMSLAILVGSSGVALHAAPFFPATGARGAAVSPPLIPVVVFGKDGRRTPEAFAAEHHLDTAGMRSAHNASGLIQCGDAHGAGQLTLSTNVITTAAHVFFDENGIARASTCTFDLTIDGKPTVVPIDLSSIVAGSSNPYAVEPAYDWAVARLGHRVANVKPYAIASDIHTNEPMTFVARGHIDWGDGKKLSVEECLLHDQISAAREGTREFSFDCDTGDGASGGALMFDKERTQIGGILVGWRSNRPFNAVPFSHTHYNFAVTLEGDFRRAVIAAAGNMMVQK